MRSGAAAGARLLVDLRREKYYLTGAYEVDLQRILTQLLHPGATFWDIGGHAGFFTVLAARYVGSGGHVRVFEPQPANRRRIEAAVSLNHLDNVTIYPCAVAARRGSATLCLPNGQREHEATSTWTLVAEQGTVGHRITVDVRTLDELAGELGPPDVIKLDIEGAELDALRGGYRLLATQRPVIIVEFHSAALLAEGRKILDDHAFEQISGDHWLIN